MRAQVLSRLLKHKIKSVYHPEDLDEPSKLFANSVTMTSGSKRLGIEIELSFLILVDDAAWGISWCTVFYIGADLLARRVCSSRALERALIPSARCVAAWDWAQEEGDQLRWWELAREFVSQLGQSYGAGGVRAVFPDAGGAAMLKNRWGNVRAPSFLPPLRSPRRHTRLGRSLCLGG